MLNTLDCKKEWSWLPPTLFFLFVSACIFYAKIYADYGVSWDEPFMRLNGQINLNYICYKLNIHSCYDPSLPLLYSHFDRAYGVAFEIPLILIEKYFRLVDSRDIYTARHICIYLYSLLGLAAFYRIIYYRFRNHILSTVGVFLLGFSPRIFAESFYNNKDIVFMYSNLIGLLCIIYFIKSPSLTKAVLSGFSTAFSIDIRVMGVMLIIATAILLIMSWYNKAITVKYLLFYLIAYLLCTIVFTYALFPFLWENPWENFLYVIDRATRFPWPGQNLYYGIRILGSQLPWHYAPTWILITTPPIVTIFFVIGLSAVIRTIMNQRLDYLRDLRWIFDFLIIGMAISPLLSVIILHSTMYDGWRQLYFIYPFVVLISIRGIDFITYHAVFSQKFKQLVAGIIIFQFFNIGYWMYSAHPLENVYFNFLAGKNWNENFEMDYWGQGNTFVIKNILALDKRPSLSMTAVSSTLLSRAMLMLYPVERKRITILLRPEDKDNEILRDKNINEMDMTSDKVADYILNNYRGVTDAQLTNYSTYYDLFYTKNIFDEKIIEVYKNKITTKYGQ